VAGAVRINLDNFTSAQKNINSAVIEYLLKNGLMNTVDTMQDELIGQRLGGMEKNMLFDENTGISHMLNAFDLGKREHFFISWNRFVPIQLRSGDLKCQKLEFYIHIYFAIYPALPDSGQNDKDLKRELGQFKIFLDTKGAELS
jgi:LisH domain-containing protein ARMC9